MCWVGLGCGGRQAGRPGLQFAAHADAWPPSRRLPAATPAGWLAASHPSASPLQGIAQPRSWHGACPPSCTFIATLKGAPWHRLPSQKRPQLEVTQRRRGFLRRPAGAAFVKNDARVGAARAGRPLRVGPFCRARALGLRRARPAGARPARCSGPCRRGASKARCARCARRRWGARRQRRGAHQPKGRALARIRVHAAHVGVHQGCDLGAGAGAAEAVHGAVLQRGEGWRRGSRGWG